MNVFFPKVSSASVNDRDGGEGRRVCVSVCLEGAVGFICFFGGELRCRCCILSFDVIFRWLTQRDVRFFFGCFSSVFVALRSLTFGFAPNALTGPPHPQLESERPLIRRMISGRLPRFMIHYSKRRGNKSGLSDAQWRACCADPNKAPGSDSAPSSL